MEVREPSARYVEALQPPLVRQFGLLVSAPDAVARLRELILTLAVQGKLVPQDPNDEAADALLQEVVAERQRLISTGRIKSGKTFEQVGDNDGPFPLPPNWQWIRLGSALEMINGRAFKPSDWLPTGLPIVRIQNLNNEAASFNYCDPATVDPRHFIDSGDFLISWSGTPGTSFGAFIWRRGPAALNQHIFRCELIADVFSPEFLRLAINSQLNVLISRAQGGVGLQHVTKGALESLVLLLPPRAEQARIVVRVDELMRLCDALEAKGRLEAEQHARLLGTLLGTLTDSATAEELAANWQRVAAHFDLLLDRPEAVDALEQTILQLAIQGLLVQQDPGEEPAFTLIDRIQSEREQALRVGALKRDKPPPPIGADDVLFSVPAGWAWARLGRLTLQVTDGTHHTPRYQPDGVAFISVKDIDGTTVLFKDCKFISEEEHRQINARCNPERGDILLCRIGTLGRPTIVDTIRPFSLFVSVGLLKLPKSVDICAFLHMVLSSPWMKKEYDRIKAGGSHTNKLNLGDIPLLMIPIAPLAEQSRIVARVTELRRLCADLRRHLAASQATQSHLADAIVEQALA